MRLASDAPLAVQIGVVRLFPQSALRVVCGRYREIRSFRDYPDNLPNRAALEENARGKMNPGHSFEPIHHSQDIEGSEAIAEEVAVRINVRGRATQHFSDDVPQEISC